MMKQRKTVVVLMLILLFCLSTFAGCTSAPADSSQSVQPADLSETELDEAPPEDTSVTAGEASKALLVVSFGTSYNDTRKLTIDAIEERLQQAYPDYEMRRAFTSQTIINILADREGLEIDNVTQAMDRLVEDGVQEVVVQPTHIMSGFEYEDMINEITPYQHAFDVLYIGAPLLTSATDFDAVAKVLAEETAQYNEDGTAIVFMGHGTAHEANAVYAKLQEHVHAAGDTNFFIGTVEGAPDLEDVMAQVEASGATKVVLLPFMVVAGDHATNDMAGDEEDSWKNAFESEGYEVECVLKGLGEYTGIQELYIKHVAEAIGESTPSKVIEAKIPLYANQIEDGAYPIEVSSSSSMFRIVEARLTVAGGEMSAVLTLSGTGYEKLYMGTGEEAASDLDDACIYFVEDDEGRYTYSVPVSALNQEIDVAAWSIRKQSWYDRVLVFQSSLIPEEAIAPLN